MSFAGLIGRIIILAVLVTWGWKLIFVSIASNGAGESFLHLVNTPFHEAGHVFFRPFGSFLTSLGGTLGQLLMPLVCTTVFLLQTRDTFAASVGLWWFGENFLDIAPYIGDARAGVLPLLGGNTGHSSPYGFHDWEFLLTETGLLRYDQPIARLSHGIGSVIMLLAVAWGGYILWKTYWEAV
ncbi:Zincin peptidase [Candidatus Electrothrix laxa]